MTSKKKNFKMSARELRPVMNVFNQRFSPFLWLKIQCDICHQQITRDDLLIFHYRKHGRLIAKHIPDKTNKTKIDANSEGEQSDEDKGSSDGEAFDPIEMVSTIMDEKDIKKEPVEEYQAPKIVVKKEVLPMVSLLKRKSAKENSEKELCTDKVEDPDYCPSHLPDELVNKRKKKKYTTKNTKYAIPGTSRFEVSERKPYSVTVEDNIRLEEQDPFVMPTCSNTFSTIKLAYIKDPSSNEVEERLKCYVACKVCDRFFNTTQQLSLHRNKYHARNFSYLRKYIFNETAYGNRLGETMSDDSSKSSEEDDNVTRHLENVRNEFKKPAREKVEENPQEYICEYCSKIKRNKGDLNHHIKTVHLPKMEGNEDLLHYCDRCTFKTGNKRTLKKHIWHIHEGVPRKKYEHKYNYDPIKRKLKRKSLAGAPKQFVCKYCGWAGTLNCHLTYHIEKKHLNIKRKRQKKLVNGKYIPYEEAMKYESQQQDDTSNDSYAQ